MEARKLWRKQLQGDVRWVPPQQLFLPLRYLGELQVSKSKQLCRKLEQLCRETSPIQLSVDRIGGAPSDAEAQRLWLGFEPSNADKKPFGYRLTLSRSSQPQTIPNLNVKNNLKGFKVKGISLIESRTGQDGPSYHTLRKFALSGESR